MNFWPQWSPDGKYMAVMTSGSKGTSGYDLVYGEASPLAASQSITVLDAAGAKVASVDLSDKMVACPFWSDDSGTLGFFGATKATDVFPGLRLDSVWAAKVSALPKLPSSAAPSSLVSEKIADFPSGSGHTWYTEAAFVSDGSGVYFRTGSYEQDLVWFASKGKVPVQVLPGRQLAFIIRGKPMGVFEESIVALTPSDGKVLVGLLTGGEFKAFGEMDESDIVDIAGIGSGVLVVRGANAMSVFKMYTEGK